MVEIEKSGYPFSFDGLVINSRFEPPFQSFHHITFPPVAGETRSHTPFEHCNFDFEFWDHSVRTREDPLPVPHLCPISLLNIRLKFYERRFLPDRGVWILDGGSVGRSRTREKNGSIGHESITVSPYQELRLSKAIVADPRKSFAFLRYGILIL